VFVSNEGLKARGGAIKRYSARSRRYLHVVDHQLNHHWWLSHRPRTKSLPTIHYNYLIIECKTSNFFYLSHLNGSTSKTLCSRFTKTGFSDGVFYGMDYVFAYVNKHECLFSG